MAGRVLGKTGFRLGPVGFGSGQLGELFVPVSDDEADDALRAVWEAGIRYIDTAPHYGSGLAELRVGQFLESHRQDAVVVSTKVGHLLRPPRDPARFRGTEGWCGGLPLDQVYDYSRRGVLASYRDSLKRLGLQRVDLLVIHDLDYWHHRDEATLKKYWNQFGQSGWAALADLRASGEITAIGAGINQLGFIPRFLDSFDLDFFLIAGRYTLLDQSALASELPLCAREGVGVILGGVFNSGILASGPVAGAKFDYADASPEILEQARKLESVCRRYETPLAAAAIQFPLGHPAITCVLFGATSRAEIEIAVRNMKQEVPDGLWADLKRQGLLHEDAPVPPSV